jgi:four helix bundle protein
MAYNDFTQMNVWQIGLRIAELVYKLTENLPKREDYALCGQLRTAAVSISANIAEGFGRGHIKDKIKFYLISRGSACEVKSHLFVAEKVGYFKMEEINPILKLCNDEIEELNKINKTLNAQSQSQPQSNSQQ